MAKPFTWYDQHGVKRCDTTVRSDMPGTWSSIRMGRKGLVIGTNLIQLCMYNENYNHLSHNGRR